MPISEHQVKARASHIGSSDSAALLGVDPYRTAYDVWLDKTGRLERQAGPASEAAEIGNMLEDGLLDWASAELGMPIVRNQYRVHEGGILSANHDALVKAAPVGLEAKTAGITGRFAARDDWGDPGTDQVPERVLIQCHHQMIVSNLARVFVPALLGGRGRVMFQVELNADLAEAILAAATAFWRNCVELDTPPTNAPPSFEVIRRAKREEGKAVPLDSELVARWMQARELEKIAAEKRQAIEAAILAALGDAEVGETADGVLTYRSQTRRALDAKALAVAYPEISEQYMKETSYRVMRWKGEKK